MTYTTDDTNHRRESWAVAVFAARETRSTLVAAVGAVARACAGNDACVDILVNGNRALADAIAHDLAAQPIVVAGVRLRIWFLALGDKAQTWNSYIHHIYPGADLAYFVDGYARPASDAFKQLAQVLRTDGHALAATGVPSCGISATRQRQQMQQDGGLHGNLFALKRVAVDEIRQRGFRLPIGLYRTDSLIGAVLNFGFDPSINSWDPSRIRVHPGVTWRFDALHFWRWRDLVTHLRRKGRQSLGELENLAVRDHLALRRQPPEQLPKTASALVLGWWGGRSGPGVWQIALHPGWLWAIRRFRERRDWSTAETEPMEVWQSGAGVRAEAGSTGNTFGSILRGNAL